MALVDTHRRNTPFNMAKSAPRANGKGPMYDMYPTSVKFSKPKQEFASFPPRTGLPGEQTNGLSAVTEGFGRLNLQPPSFGAPNRSNSRVSTASYDGGVSLGASIPHAFLYNGQIVLAGSQVHPGMAQNPNTMAQAPGMYASVPPPFVNQNGFQYPHQFMNGASPMSSWPSSRVPSSEMPTLVTPRRDSSSSQENDLPGTPFTQYTNYGEYNGGVTIIDRSPNSIYGPWSTPSPAQYNQAKAHHSVAISPRLQLLVQQEPPIPRAVPAPYSPMKPLDRALENVNGVTNVYIRGLNTDTTDDMLHKLAARFGDIVSSKSIIDMSTGKCKGFGFVKYHNFRDAEDCIRGFHYMGYETSFARESFYSQLKKLADDANTNLYVSNLPKDMNEHELSAIFEPYKVCSARILRDPSGNGRGVGFARFESREICEEVMKSYNNMPVCKGAGQEHLIQIRYADTPDQKNLKQQTNAARQFRAAEYDAQTQGPAMFSMPPARFSGAVANGRGVDNDFETYMTNANGVGFGQKGMVEHAARNRLTNVSSHLNGASGPPVVNVNLPNTIPSGPEARIAMTDGNDRKLVEVS